MVPEKVTYLFQKTSFLYYVGHSFHLDTLGFIDVLESIKLASLLVLDDAHLYIS
jgi:hypothetical protein